jgi:type 1 glutamine amidotransferase
MKNTRFLLLGLVLSLLPLLAAAADLSTSPQKLRVLVITGGHEFEHDPFFQVFKDNTDITFQTAEHPNAHALLKAEGAKSYDVLVLYDMHQEITDEAKADFVARLKEGKGLVVLHHAIAAYQGWPEYERIIGARFYINKTVVDGVEKPQSLYLHGVHFKIHVADPQHPVTRGVADYAIVDETYKSFALSPDIHPLLTTDEPTSDKVIGWSKTYGPARVVYLESGHDHTAYENPNYRKILAQAIQWVAGRD